MNEAHFKEIERTLLYVSEAQKWADNAAKKIAKDDAEEHLVRALEQAAADLRDVHRRLMQRTYFAVPGEQEDLFKASGGQKKLSV